ncbi:MAG TPA: tetratricopeptide repeat protein [Candidatus Gracilibacteria bacterium]|nr:tetratricopeptide repeat protein [Candidatus Gracilibacteria bacterium]
MNKALTTIIVLTLLFFAVTFFYVFELPPFNPGGPFIPARTEDGQTQISEELPEFLSEEGVSRAKTYEEHMNRGKLLAQKNYNALAIAEYESASKLQPKKIEPLIEIGKLNFSGKDYLKARLTFEQALKITPDSIDASVMLARTYIAERKTTEAKKILDDMKIHSQQSKYYQGLLAAAAGESDRAKNLLHDVITIGGNLETSERAKIALGAYDEFNFSQGGPDVHLKTLLGRSFDQIGEYDMAVAILIEVIKEKKDYRDAWILLGYAYLKTEKYQDSTDALMEARKLDPQKPETSFFLGLSYFGLQDLKKAAEFLELAKSNGFEPRVQVEQKLAEVYLQMQEYEKASLSYEAVLSLNDQDVNYFIKPIWIYLDRLNQPEKAVALANKAVAAHPKEAMSYNLLGWTSTGAGRLDEAQKYLDKARTMDPNLDAVYLNYGVLSEKRGDRDAAAAYYKKAYDIGMGSGIAMAAADRYNRLIGGGSLSIQNGPALKASLLQQ